MKIEGILPNGVEVGNAWHECYPSGESTNWIVGDWNGHIPQSSLRFVPRDKADPLQEAMLAKHVSVKWFVHETDNPPQWGELKPSGVGRTISLMADAGKFALDFENEDVKGRVILDKPGDFAIWGEGVDHAWRPIERSTILTIRWEPQ